MGRSILCKSLRLFFPSSVPYQRSFHITPSCQTHTQIQTQNQAQSSIQESIKTAIKTNNFQQIPLLLSPSYPPHKTLTDPKFNPFSFLSSLPTSIHTQILDQILQSLLPLRPRSLSHPTLSFLLSHTLLSPSSLPLSLSVLRHFLRSGSSPVPQTRLSLSQSWIHCRRSQSISDIISDARTIGYALDTRTINYLLSCLCSVDQLVEAVLVLRAMPGSRLDPDSESYAVVIGAACGARWTEVAEELAREMVGKLGLAPRQGMVARLVSTMRADGELQRAAEMVRWLERKGWRVGFESWERVVEGCLERGEYVLAGKMVVEMAERGLIPYIKARLRVVEGLASIGERELASAVRQKLAELNS